MFFENNKYKINENKEWEYYSYEKLIKFIDDNISVTNCYHKSLINDYCDFIKILQKQIVEKMNCIDIVDLYTKGTVENKMLVKLTKLRMHDFFQKGIFENYANEVKNKIDDNEVKIEHGMTRSVGLLDVQIKFEDITMGIQIQGEQYRKFICSETKEKVADLAKKYENELFESMLPEKSNPKLKKYGEDLKFNKYDTSKYLFLYKYENLKSMSNDKLTKKIIDDCEEIIKLNK